MGFETRIRCDECGRENSFVDMRLDVAEENFYAEGGSEAKGKYLCALCTWQHRINYFAIDVDIQGNRDYQVLAVVKDKNAFAGSRISFGRLDTKSDIVIRRISQPEYETLIEFGIPAAEPCWGLYYARRKDESLFHNSPNKDYDPTNDKSIITNYNMDENLVIDLSDAVEALLTEKLPKAGTPEDIIKSVQEK